MPGWVMGGEDKPRNARAKLVRVSTSRNRPLIDMQVYVNDQIDV